VFPFFDGLYGSTVRQGALRDVVIVGCQIVHEGGFQFIGGSKTGLLEDFLNATVHALDDGLSQDESVWSKLVPENGSPKISLP
jgi:hypothetical protein